MQKVLFFIIFSVFLVQSVFAGNTGKIFGRVTDKNSGDALVGVNVVIVGQLLGASTDENGEYYILNISPGIYTVECSYVGYQTTSIQGVQIKSDQTSALDISIFEQVMEMDEKIIVVADRPLVQKDLTASKKVTTTEEIKALPVESYAGIMLTQAGITQGADGALHIRGGRSTEIAYLVDGVSVSNPFSTNGLATSVATNAIQEMTVVSGAFNAEYGNAMSGVVNFTTKDGAPDFQTFVSFYTGDYVSSHKKIFTNIEDFNALSDYTAEGTISGPLSFLGNKNNTYFFSARYNYSEGYLYGIREHLPGDSANFEPKQYITVEKDDNQFITTIEYRDEWYIEQGGDGEFVSMNPGDGVNLLGKLKFQITPGVVLRYQSLYTQAFDKNYVHAYKYNPEGTYNYYSNSTNNALHLTQLLNNSTFYELKAALNTRNYEQYVYKNYAHPDFAPSNLVEGSPGGTTFNFSGQQDGQIYEHSKTFLTKFDYTSQINKQHLFKSGFEGRINVLDRENFSIGYDRNTNNAPTKVYGGKYLRYPRQFTAYAQDKMEYYDMILNAGLRYDYFYSDAPYAVDELQPDGERKQAEAKNMLAPRLGISYPITSEGIIHLSYGHFFQMPALSDLYSNPSFLLPASGTPEFGNANLRPEKTISYEIGLQQQLTSSLAFDITGFYKDIRDLLAWQTITFTRLDGDRQSYRVRRNQDYANVKGITLTLDKRARSGEPFALKVDYTFQVSEGNDNDPTAFFYNSLSGQENVKEIIPLDWDQPHNLYASLTILPTSNLTISLIGKLSAGYPYTPVIFSSNYDSEVNSERKPIQKTVDLRASYTVSLAGYHLQFFGKVYNLFDELNERYVYDDTGTADYTFYANSINEPDAFKKHYGEPGVHTYGEYVIRPDYYRAPRLINLGMSLEF